MINNKLLKRKILDYAIHGCLIKNDLSLKPVEYEQIDNKYPFEIPSNWKWLTLSQIATLSVGKTPSTSDSSLWDGDIDWISISDMKHGQYVKNTSKKITLKALDNTFNGKCVEPETLIMSFKLTIGRLSITSKKCVHNEAIVSIIPLKNICRDYLMYALDGMDLEKNVKSAIKGKTLNSKSLSILELPIPPYDEQLRIVKKIEELFELIDKKEQNDQEKEKLKTLLKDKILDNAIRGTLIENDLSLSPVDVNEVDNVSFELPSNWKWCELQNITTILGDGIHGTPIYSDDGEYYFINGNNLSNKEIIIKDGTKRVSISEYEKYKKNLNDRTILVSINGTLGNVAFYSGEKIILGKSACYFNLIDNISKDYVYWFLNTQYFVDYISHESTGTTIRNVSLKTMRGLAIPIPPLEEQKRIVEKIEQCFELIEQL